MPNRIVMGAVLTAALLATGSMSGARAQQPMGLGQPATGPSGWTFDVAPYLWFANINTNLSFNLPPALGGTVTASPSVGFGDLVSHLNIGLMGAADARYDRFSVLTDFMYLNLGGTAASSGRSTSPTIRQFRSEAGLHTSAGMNLRTTIWTLAGGYTVLRRAAGATSI